MYNGIMYTRALTIDGSSKQSFFLFGPRGTGKTTWLKERFKEAIYLDLLESELYRRLLARPEELENLIPPGFINWIVLDEIQRIPALLNEVHRLIESKAYRFVLTGSSARSLRRKGVNLLAGRALTYHMYPLTVSELAEDFSLSHSLEFGNLPLAYTSDNVNKFLDSYIQTYLKEEILQEGLTRNIGDFTRFLEIASFSQGQVLNVSEIAREAQIKRKTAEGYFAILDDLLIAYKIPVFSKRSKRRLIKHNKFYFFDVGVFRKIRPQGPLDSVDELEGAALETLFLQELIAVNSYYDLGYKIHFWRTSSGLEVDFVLYGPKGFLAFEIKRKAKLTAKDFSALRAFSKDYSEAKTFIISYLAREEFHNGIHVLPFEQAISSLRSLLTE